MTKRERITKKIEASSLIKVIDKRDHTDISGFIRNADRYIKAIKEGRVICSIGSVSSSGMSRTIKFLECNKGTTGYNYLNFYMLFDILGYQKVKDSDYFRVHGCGMDMVFHTNYTIIHNLYGLGFINKKQCDILAQQTPSAI